MTSSAPINAVPADLLRRGNLAGKWQLEPSESAVTFVVKHFWGLMSVEGRFTEMQGTVEVSETGRVQGSITICARSLSTGNKKRDSHLHSVTFFDIDNQPAITFRIDDLIMVDPDNAQVTGTLTVAGKALPTQFDARLRSIAGGAIVDVDAVVDRTDHGMTWSPMRMAANVAKVQATFVFSRIYDSGIAGRIRHNNEDPGNSPTSR